TKVGERFDTERTYLELAIPNQEIRYIYQEMILSWFNGKVKAMDRSALYQALIAGDCATVETELKRELTKSISFYDAAEQFYHGFLAGMFGGLGEYRLLSNRESGDGRADIMMLPEDEQSPVLIFELKRADKFTQMDEGCDAALAQIEEKRYDAECREEGYGKFIKYGICFCKKSCRVKVG
ncbi:MAG: PD-(D/E)XK nuclease domain-containing protein, partial [Lachnospiraceae bacterium]|nr:PD-(D/E)XK nuclease domain-containing protein [Lachnospiraceae bacterium]